MNVGLLGGERVVAFLFVRRQLGTELVADLPYPSSAVIIFRLKTPVISFSPVLSR